MLPHPGDCQILATATFWRMPNPGKCHILWNAKSWKVPDQGNSLILDAVRSWGLPHPGDCHILDAAQSRTLPHPGSCRILANVTLAAARDKLAQRGSLGTQVSSVSMMFKTWSGIGMKESCTESQTGT